MSNHHKFDKSSSIVHCDYHEDKNTMEIKFASGSTYHYPNCDKTHYEALKAAASPGKHFHQKIRSMKGNKIG